MIFGTDPPQQHLTHADIPYNSTPSEVIFLTDWRRTHSADRGGDWSAAWSPFDHDLGAVQTPAELLTVNSSQTKLSPPLRRPWMHTRYAFIFRTAQFEFAKFGDTNTLMHEREFNLTFALLLKSEYLYEAQSLHLIFTNVNFPPCHIHYFLSVTNRNILCEVNSFLDVC